MLLVVVGSPPVHVQVGRCHAEQLERTYRWKEHQHVGSHNTWQLFAIMGFFSSAESSSVSAEEMAGGLEQVQIIPSQR